MTHAIEVNCETGEVTERPLTQEEISANEAAADQQEAAEAEAAVKATAKTALLEKLGISEDEAKLLLG
jgi:hypothetical protein